MIHSIAMDITTLNKNCLQCGKPVKGRIDKKFCDDWCRNAYNNRLNSDTNKLVRNINNTLRRNRRILDELIPPGKKIARISRHELIIRGFDFRYFTHTRISRKGLTYTFCYEFGYLPADNDEYILIRARLVEKELIKNGG